MKELKGRCAIVTGASRGIGVHIARALAGEGVNLALVARTSDAIEQLGSELSQQGVRVVSIAADLAESDRLDGLIQRAEAELGAIDVLVNNAGVDGIRIFAEESDAQTEQMLRVNLLAPMLLTRKLLPKMIERQTGHIVNIASLAGKTSTPYSVSYSTTKGGLIAFTHSMRSELRGSGVSASVVSPGFVTAEGMFAKQERSHGVKVSPLLGTSSAEQVAQAVMFALRHDKAEVVVNPGPVRLLQAFNQLAPDAMAWLQDRIGIKEMLRTVAVADRPQPRVSKAR